MRYDCDRRGPAVIGGARGHADVIEIDAIARLIPRAYPSSSSCRSKVGGRLPAAALSHSSPLLSSRWRPLCPWSSSQRNSMRRRTTFVVVPSGLVVIMRTACDPHCDMGT